MSREWYRFFVALVARLGGPDGPDIGDIELGQSFAATSTGSSDAPAIGADGLAPLLSLDAVLALVDQRLDQRLSEVAPPEAPFYGVEAQLNLTPSVWVGSLGQQNADRVSISGGAIDGTPIGATTPSTGGFTTLTTSGNATIGNGSNIILQIINGNNSGAAGGAQLNVRNAGAGIIGIGNKSAILGGAYDATPYLFHNGELNTHGNMKINGYLSITGNVGFYGSPVAVKPTASGSRAGNAALASLLTGLAGLGLITDSTTP